VVWESRHRQDVPGSADGSKLGVPSGIELTSFLRTMQNVAEAGTMTNRALTAIKGLLPARTRRWLHTARLSTVGWIEFGRLRRLQPSSRNFGWERGLPIDRYYIERFLSTHAEDIKGHVLEIGDNPYTQRFGGTRVTRSDVLHFVEGNPKATIIADLTRADGIPSDEFDCIIFTQTLQMIYEVRSAIGHLFRILKRGGVVLATAHGTSKICRRFGKDPWGEYWRFTTESSQRLFQEAFQSSNVTVQAHGNLLTAVASLHGLTTEDLAPRELDFNDPDYEVLITIRAVK